MSVANVTGASYSVGRGISRSLGMHGCAVYVTGRPQIEGDVSMRWTIHSVAAEVTGIGGKDPPSLRAAGVVPPEYAAYKVK